MLTTGGDKAVREKLMYLEQFRETLRIITGKQEMRSVWPIRVVVLKNGAARGPSLGRNAQMMAVSESGAFPRESLKELARVLLYDNTNRLPQPIEEKSAIGQFRQIVMQRGVSKLFDGSSECRLDMLEDARQIADHRQFT